MTADPKKRGLGRGLDALFREVKSEEDTRHPPAPQAQSVSAPQAQSVSPQAQPPAAQKIPQAPTQSAQQAKPQVPAVAQPQKSEQPAAAETPEPKIRRAEEMVLAANAARAAEEAASARKPIQLPSSRDQVRMVAIEKLTPGALQPRRHFDEAQLEELADSISAFGILQPLIARPLPGGRFEIVGGERRWRAAQKARLHEVPVIIRDFDDRATLEVGLVENLQRADLNAVEEAEGYQRLMDEFDYTQESISQQLGKSRSHVGNLLRLLKLPAPVRLAIQTGKLSSGHARALVGAPGAAEIAAEVVARNLSVRQTEKLIRRKAAENGTAKKPRANAKPAAFRQKDVDILALEEKMNAILGLRVTIEGEGSAGKLAIEYKTLDQLDDLLDRLSRAPK